MSRSIPIPDGVEHDPLEIWRRTLEVIDEAVEARGLRAKDIACIGITNQRETTVIWNRHTGAPVYNALVWQDTRVADYVTRLAQDGGQNRFQVKTGLPLTTYFSGLKICWVLDNVKGAREQAEFGDLLFGNIDSYLVWNLTGGVNDGVHVTDVTNASRTQLMNLETLDWDDEILAIFKHSARDAAGDSVEQRALRRHEADESSRSSHRGNSGRPACGAGGADVLQAG